MVLVLKCDPVDRSDAMLRIRRDAKAARLIVKIDAVGTDSIRVEATESAIDTLFRKSLN